VGFLLPTLAAGGGRHHPLDLNFPLPNARGKAAIVKLYDFPASGEIKLTDMLELVGVVSLDPALAAQHPEEDMMGVAPLLPPPSLVPRLHVVRFTKLAHNNPLGTGRRALKAVLRHRILDPVPFLPRDPGRSREEQPGSYFLELKKQYFGLKYLNSLMGIRDGKKLDPG
jgi:hypothetical protein